MKLKEWRKQRKMTQMEFCKLANPPLHQGDLSCWETGYRTILPQHIATIRKITRGKVKAEDWANGGSA